MLPKSDASLMLLSVLVCILSIHMTTAEYYHTRDGLHTPCHFLDTVNITGDYRFPNGSYLHDDLLIPPDVVGVYDYVFLDLIRRVDVQPHQRACICKLKPCISMCCPWGTQFNGSSCERQMESYKWPEPFLNITSEDGLQQKINMTAHFVVQHFRPCETMYALQPESTSSDAYEIFENGTMFRMYDGVTLGKNEYCLVPTIVNDTDEYYIINPANCYKQSEQTTVKIINAYAMLFSIPFMILTMVVYLSIPELRNQHGKSLVCYLLGLTIGYSLLSLIALNSEIFEIGCALIGFTAYYFFMVAFFWLSVISFDLWHNFRGTRGANRFQEKKRFLIYSLYAWGLPLIFLIFTWCAQTQFDLPVYLKPGINGDEFCWLDMRTWSAMIYFYGPILIIILVNTAMFFMTALKIHKVQREMARIMAREDSTKNLRTEKDKFGLFLRLFIVMGVTWSLEILSYFVGNNLFWSRIFYISDICNAIQGFLIFLLFVMKKKVKHLITNRYNSISGSSNQRQSQYSTKTTSSMMVTNANNSTAANKEKPLISEEQRTATTSMRN